MHPIRETTGTPGQAGASWRGMAAVCAAPGQRVGGLPHRHVEGFDPRDCDPPRTYRRPDMDETPLSSQEIRFGMAKGLIWGFL